MINQANQVILKRGIVGKRPTSFAQRTLDIAEAIQDYRKSINKCSSFDSSESLLERQGSPEDRHNPHLTRTFDVKQSTHNTLCGSPIHLAKQSSMEKYKTTYRDASMGNDYSVDSNVDQAQAASLKKISNSSNHHKKLSKTSLGLQK